MKNSYENNETNSAGSPNTVGSPSYIDITCQGTSHVN